MTSNNDTIGSCFIFIHNNQGNSEEDYCTLAGNSRPVSLEYPFYRHQDIAETVCSCFQAMLQESEFIDSSSSITFINFYEKSEHWDCRLTYQKSPLYRSQTEITAQSSTSIEDSIRIEISLIRLLIERGDIREARNALDNIGISPGISKDLDNIRSVLAPPKAHLKDEGTSRNPELNLAWLEENAQEYQGKWVALLKGRLLGQDSNRSKLRKRIGEESTGALFVKL